MRGSFSISINYLLIPPPQVTLDMVRADIPSSEEQNATETAKTYKVTCDRRNITGVDSFTVQVLNASQVLCRPQRRLPGATTGPLNHIHCV